MRRQRQKVARTTRNAQFEMGPFFVVFLGAWVLLYAVRQRIEKTKNSFISLKITGKKWKGLEALFERPI